MSAALLDDTPPSPEARGATLLSEARRIKARNPHSSFDNIWHTLWLLEAAPAERLRRSLIRGRSAPLFSEREEWLLQALVEEGVAFLVVGAAAALQGAPAVTQDVDLWFRDLSDPALKRALRRVGATYIPPGPHNPPLLAGGDAGLFDVVVNMHGLGSFVREARRAVRIPIGAVEVLVLPLSRIIASKRATGRPKDRAILPALEDALRVLKSRNRSARRPPPRRRRRRRR